MAGIIFEIDPTSEDATNANLPIVDNSTYFLIDYNDDPNPWDVMRASSADTEGEFVVQNRPTNRTVMVKLRVIAASASALETVLYGLQQKIGKLVREGGTLKKTTPSGDTVVFDVQGATISGINGQRYVKGVAAEPTLTFECDPYARGAAVLLSDHVETTLPCIVFTETSLAGDVPGLGKLVVDEDQGVDQWWAVWGVQSRYYDSASSAALFYEAESRTPTTLSAPVPGPSGASGAGADKVIRNTNINTRWQAVMTTQASGAGAHLSHVGDYRVFARIQYPTTNTGALSMALEWGEGDFSRFTRNATVPISIVPTFGTKFGGGVWHIVDLGSVHLTKVPSGTQQWQGRILAKSTVASDDIDIDWLMLIPTTEGSGELTVTPRLQTATTFNALDTFDQTSGALNGKTANTGGTWGTSGSGTDLAVVTGTDGNLQRSTTDGSARFAVLGSTTYTAVQESIDVIWTAAASINSGLLVRYVDSSNYLLVALNMGSSTGPFYLSTSKVVAGAVTSLDVTFGVVMSVGEWKTFTVQVDAAGRGSIFLGPQGSGSLVAVFQDAVLATGGALATGKAGIYDGASTPANTRAYDNFTVAPLVAEAAIAASQSLEIRDDRVVREDSGGTLLVSPSGYEGDYLKVPPAGKETRSARFIVKASRNRPGSMPDPAIDDISARLTYVPRYLVVPQ